MFLALRYLLTVLTPPMLHAQCSPHMMSTNRQLRKASPAKVSCLDRTHRSEGYPAFTDLSILLLIKWVANHT